MEAKAPRHLLTDSRKKGLTIPQPYGQVTLVLDYEILGPSGICTHGLVVLSFASLTSLTLYFADAVCTLYSVASVSSK